ncbi:hypothetical protein BCP12_059 [Bacillus phage BCP12]|uniref:Uncharacterized protein n=1 Tax=Bacillus phage BCP12 TaxID=1913122 RepID=A0A2S0CSM3_9CAUD|nr:hypothetical protein BCP12_059 [Bacillus phage BCP12]
MDEITGNKKKNAITTVMKNLAFSKKAVMSPIGYLRNLKNRGNYYEYSYSDYAFKFYDVINKCYGICGTFGNDNEGAEESCGLNQNMPRIFPTTILK